MPRELVIGNGNMLINFDSYLNMRDLYYPYVGQWNHIGGNKNRLGVWADGKFSWCEEDNWQRNLKYKKDTLITSVHAHNEKMGLDLYINDAVYITDSIYLKKITVKNLWPKPREARIFLNHDFNIDETEVGDTALYDPFLDTVYHYKKNKYFMMNGFSEQGGIYEFATGTKRFQGAEGTWRDAEDGQLQGNAIAQGSVDSTVSFRLLLQPEDEQILYYWMAVGRNFQDIKRLNDYVLEKKPESLFYEIETYWNRWLDKNQPGFGDLPKEVIGLYKRSLLVIRTQVDQKGAITAANDSDIMQNNRDHYSYMWPRDGALVAFALIKAGYPEMTKPFFNFCENALTNSGFLLHKYNPDGSVGSSWHPWYKKGRQQLPIQEDETALVLFALWEYYLKTRDIEFCLSLYRTLIRPAAQFMVKYMIESLSLPEPSFDLWEERHGIFTFTVAAVYGGLIGAANFASLFGDNEKNILYQETAHNIKKAIEKNLYDKELGRFIRGIYPGLDGSVNKDLTLESSIYGLVEFGVYKADDPKIVSTMKAIESGLWVKTGIGGIARYMDDGYFQRTKDIATVPGNPWIISTMWLAEWYIEYAHNIEDLKRPLELFDWVAKRAMVTGIFPEQVHPFTGEPLSVAPLTWSHSSFVLAVNKYLLKKCSIF